RARNALLWPLQNILVFCRCISDAELNQSPFGCEFLQAPANQWETCTAHLRQPLRSGRAHPDHADESANSRLSALRFYKTPSASLSTFERTHRPFRASQNTAFPFARTPGFER